MAALLQLGRVGRWRAHLLAIWGVHLLLGSRCLAATAAGVTAVPAHDSDIHNVIRGHSIRGISRSRSTGSNASSSSQHGTSSRHLLHLEALDTADSTDAAAAAEMASMYPRDASSIQRYLRDVLRSGNVNDIPVWFVVVVDQRNPRSTLSQQQLEQQVQLLNRAYTTGLPDGQGSISEDAGAGRAGILWRFRFMGVRYTTSSTPMCIGSKLEVEIKSLWHPKLVEATRNAGQASVADRTLIIYTSDLTSPACAGYVPGYKALFGWSNTPMELAAWRKHGQAFKDGVVLDYRYLYHHDAAANEAGGKSLRGASTGAQLIHEVGHFMGLLHTFVGGCTSSMAYSDGVDDTPPVPNPRSWGIDLGDASGGCIAGSRHNTCPGYSGLDPENYMSYNNLACAKRFTPGQQARMLYVFKTMRASTQ